MPLFEKECARCRVIKSINEFNLDRQKKDGFRSYCNACHWFNLRPLWAEENIHDRRRA